MNYSAILTEARSELSSLESKVEKLKRFILSLESLADTEDFDSSKPVTTGQRKTKEAPGFIKDDSLDRRVLMPYWMDIESLGTTTSQGRRW